jgi:protein-S-isoprenylcysteine O-methyltransferase Ste14
MPIDFSAKPNVLPWPPLMALIAFVAAIALDFIIPLHLDLPSAVRAIGAVLIVGGLALYGWGVATMTRAKTNMLPNRAAGRLVDWGALAVSRHPIYVGGAIAFLGLGVAANHGWICVAALAFALAIDRFGMAREEAHMAARFGAEWTRYAARTPRWLGRGSLRVIRGRDEA